MFVSQALLTMKKSGVLHFLILFGIIISLSVPSCKFSKGEKTEDEVVQDTIYPLGFCTDSFDMIQGTLKPGENFNSLLTKLGLSYEDAHNLASISASSFDMRKMRAGNAWQAYYDVEDNEVRSLQFLVYEEDKLNTTIFRCTPPFDLWRRTKPVEMQRKCADVTISSSMWNDMVAAGVTPLLIVELSEIYAWTIDFFALQPGDRFRVLYDQEVCDGEVIDVHTVYYALFNRDNKEIPAIMLDMENGGNIYWNEKGESLKKAFLKAPLKFSRISSGFTYHRKHPVTGKVKAHTGVDYAAPKGTPVMSIGDGTVVSKGWFGGGGNTVKIRHNSVYTTAYLHLSRYAPGIKPGVRVSQGDVIGYVGSTGLSTGPHLDFRVWKNGTPINPLTMESPASEPLPREKMPLLDSLSRVYRAQMDSLCKAR